MSKCHPARSCGFVGNPTLFKHFCQTGFCEQLFHVLRTSATTVAHLPGPSSLSNNTMRDTFVFFFARARRNLQKPLGFLRIVAPRNIKSHESHRRSSKNTCTNFQNFYPRALSESYKTNGFSTFVTHELARATIARSFNAVARLPGATIPCK